MSLSSETCCTENSTYDDFSNEVNNELVKMLTDQKFMMNMRMEDMILKLTNLHNIGFHHGLIHFTNVRNHAIKALKYENLSDRKKLQVEFAALLHDVDDKKLFPNSVNNENARKILAESVDIDDKQKFIDDIISMIDLVSCSKNGDSEPPEPWMAIPRDCDRLEAIGQIGIDRCKEFTDYKKAPYHVENTTRASNEEEVWKAATPERFVLYMKGAQSASMLDHYYDKLLHIGKPECLRSQNKYILEEAARRNNIMVEFVIKYWKDNSLI